MNLSCATDDFRIKSQFEARHTQVLRPNLLGEWVSISDEETPGQSFTNFFDDDFPAPSP